jgi:hypothetical protein
MVGSVGERRGNGGRGACGTASGLHLLASCRRQDAGVLAGAQVQQDLRGELPGQALGQQAIGLGLVEIEREGIVGAVIRGRPPWSMM